MPVSGSLKIVTIDGAFTTAWAGLVQELGDDENEIAGWVRYPAALSLPAVHWWQGVLGVHRKKRMICAEPKKSVFSKIPHDSQSQKRIFTLALRKQ